MKKRIISLIMVMLMVLTLVPSFVFADAASDADKTEPSDASVVDKIKELFGFESSINIVGPEDVAVKVGETAKFTVDVKLSLLDKLKGVEYSYLWFERGTLADADIPEGSKLSLEDILKLLGNANLSSGQEYVLENVTLADNGRSFACLVYSLSEKVLAVSDTATLTVTAADPEPTPSPDPSPTPDPKPTSDPKCTHKGAALVPSKAPTCTEDGNIAYFYCADCGKYFSDPSLLIEESAESVKLTALGHQYSGGKCERCGAIDPAAMINPFVDVSKTDYFYNDVLWAYYKDPRVTEGTDATHFSPNEPCTRAQVVTFLWRAAGCPKPVSATCPFLDVQPGKYFYDAITWASEQGIAAGITETAFCPYDTVTRAQFVTFLWRFENKPAPTSTVSPFIDVRDASSPYYTAILWAAETGVTSGRTPITFAPNDPCSRANVVAFLHRDLGGK